MYPAPLLPFIEGASGLHSHTVKVAKSQGWDRLSNGERLTEAENAALDVLVTPDKNTRYQQNFAGRRIAIVVIGHAQWPVLRRPVLRQHVQLVLEAVNAATPGSYTEVEIPHRP